MNEEQEVAERAPSADVVAQLDVAACHWHERLGSTMDEAHRLAAAGAPAGTLVIAARQEAGRGRSGRSWQSEPGAGVWMTMLERPSDARALDVLALRVGLHLALALDAMVTSPVTLKWPNDLQVERRKLAGILIEARWRDGLPEWVAIGVGINRRVPSEVPEATALRAECTRDDVLRAAAPAMRVAARATGLLTRDEVFAFEARDAARGRRVREPLVGRAVGITATGALLIDTDGAGIQPVHSGSLVFADDAGYGSSAPV